MKNISFDNPYLLLIAIPLLLITVIPFVIAIRKDNKNARVITSLVLHLVIVGLVALAAAGTVYTSVVTRTEVYVVADVSYSANRNLDKIDGYIRSLYGSVPQNSGIGVVCFGKDYQLLTEKGTEFTSVKNAQVDDSSTNIAPAMEYAATLFGEDTIKRVVLITDGKQSEKNGDASLVRAVENLYAKGIRIDVIYVDDNISDDAHEVQISGVDYTGATYLNHETTADVLVQSSYETKAVLTLSRNGEKVADKAVSLTKGYNIVNIGLDTSTEGSFDYEISVDAQGDESPHNNCYPFHQSVSGKTRMLLVTSSHEDAAAVRRLYGETSDIDVYINGSLLQDPDSDTPSDAPLKLPYVVEDLCKYDEFVLSNVDVRDLDNYTTFVDSVDKVVSLFGKSLITIGDLQIQNKTDDVLKQLENMLPVRFGNSDQDAKLYGIVIDTSRSMQNMSRLWMMKDAAIQLLGLLNDDDYVTVISFAGDVSVVQPPIEASHRREIAEMIEAIAPSQGTFLGKGLSTAYELMNRLDYSEKQLMLISDGMPWAAEPDDPDQTAKNLRAAGITTSVINVASPSGERTLTNIAAAGGGKYYYLEKREDVQSLILTEVADDITESVIEEQTEVTVVRPRDGVLGGIEALPDIYGYVYAKAKSSATTVLTVDYKKNGGGITKSALYSHWNYGNGSVACFTGGISGAWAKDWESGKGEQFLKNISAENTPTEKIDYPYTLHIGYDGNDSTVELIPAVLNPNATVTADITLPDGDVYSANLVFDSAKYSYRFETPVIGKYTVHITYTYVNASFESTSVFHLPYSPEYDSFATFSPSVLHRVMRNRGTVSGDVVPKIENDEKEIATYVVSFTIPFLILAIILYVADVIIRKLTFNDIKSLFKKSTAHKGGNV